MTESFDNWFCREFVGEEHWKFLQQTYDESRAFLKKCGKPKDDGDRYLIDFHRFWQKK